jgi:hypothetical protein
LPTHLKAKKQVLGFLKIKIKYLNIIGIFIIISFALNENENFK